MAHQNTPSTSGVAQNAATDRNTSSDEARERRRSVRPEPRSYVARDVTDATLAAPAAGEMSDYADEGPASFGAQQGATNTRRPVKTEGQRGQGRRTREANRRMTRSGSPDQGPH